MKRLISIALAVVMSLSLSTPIFAANRSKDSLDPLENPLKDAVPVFEPAADPLSNVKVSTNNTETIAVAAARYLEEMKVLIGDSCESLGYAPEVFYNMSADTPYIIYTFDRFGNILSDDIYSSPLIYDGEIVGLITVKYNDVTDCYDYSLGEVYGPELDHIKDSKILNTNHGIVIGRITDKIFATDGTNVEILFEEPCGTGVSAENIKAIAAQLAANASSNYQPIVPVQVVSASESQCAEAESEILRSYLARISAILAGRPIMGEKGERVQ